VNKINVRRLTRRFHLLESSFSRVFLGGKSYYIKKMKQYNEMYCEVICNQSSSQLEVSPSKRQANIASINKGITFWCYSFSLFHYCGCNLSFVRYMIYYSSRKEKYCKE
jgi:hypothetical protein